MTNASDTDTPLAGFTPHPPEFAQRWRDEGYWRDQSLRQVFGELFETHADRVAVIGDDGQLTYGELHVSAVKLAANLYDVGLRPLDRVVVQMPNSVEFVQLYFALQWIGAIPIAALPAHRYREMSHFVENSGAVAVATAEVHRRFDHTELNQRLADEESSLKFCFTLSTDEGSGTAGDAMVDLRSLLDTEPPESAVTAVAGLELDPEAPCVMQLSGGTTGVPKLIPRSHNDYACNSRLASAVCDINPDDTLLLVLPIEHNLPLACPGLQGFLMAGARVVVSAKMKPAEVFDLVDRHGVTHIHAVPALLIGWVGAEGTDGFDLGSVRVIQSGGQRLQPEIRNRVSKRFANCTVQENFGMAEGLLLFVRLDDPEDVRLETCGRTICNADEVRLVDEHDVEVPDGEVGEMICRGPYTLRGYFNAPEHNRRAFTDDGFYRSGDLMFKHPTGNYVVAGRRKDLINRGGEKISAEEIENLILQHPSVDNVACVPYPDERLGERMCACVELRPGTELELADLVDFLLGYELAKYKLPERLEVYDAFPLSNVGKVSKKDLVAQLAEQGAS